MIVIIILIGLIVAFGAYAIGTYNKFVITKELISNSKAQIATQIESRWDALSNLISATKQYSTHEAETLASVVKGRQQLTQSASTSELENAESTFQSSLSKLIAVAENYPELKASNLYQETMASVNKYETNVRLSRMTFNDTVTKYNRLIKMVPANIIAKMTGFEPEDYLKMDDNKKEMPDWE